MLSAAARKRNPLRQTRLSELCTMQVGGPVELVDLHDLRDLPELRERGFRMLGKGANVLAAEELTPARVLRLGRPFAEFSMIEEGAGARVRVGAACDLAVVIKRCAAAGLAGCEGLAGVPASLGGALWMNAGTAQRWIGEVVDRIRVLLPDAREACWLARPDYDPTYRSARLPAGSLILGAELLLERGDPATLRQRASDLKRKKAASQPLAAASAGCIFKNPAPDLAAGALIDACGCKGWREGAAVVSTQHANFIVNEGGARADAVFRLIERLRARVFAERGVVLAVEVQVWDGPTSLWAHPGEVQ